jgi:hypothetical protein
MKTSIFLISLIMLFGCGTTTKVDTSGITLDENKDVYILSRLIQDYFRNTNGREMNLNDLIQIDTLERISNNFETIKVELGGNISVFYKFTESRDAKDIELSEIEKKEIQKFKWKIKKIREPFDGEIQYEYGERNYIIRKISVQ